jgi:glutamine amidotransferase
MCRILSYLGIPIWLEELLYLPDNSFIKQSYHPKYMSHLLNLAGFGLVAWEANSYDPSLPFIYKTPGLPFYDDNLHNLVKKITPYCILSHLRGVSYSDTQIVSDQNVHPFMFEGTHLALAHNGALVDFNTIKYDMLEQIKPEYRKFIHGTTDSEHIYALFLSQLPNLAAGRDIHEVAKAIIETLKIIKTIRKEHNISINSPVNIFISNGSFIAATRFVYDYGWQPDDAKDLAHFAYHSLWYTFGEGYGLYDNEYKMKNGSKKSSIIIASEPLTEDTTSWIEVPEYSLIIAEHKEGEINIISQDINL